ncbi:MAG: flippase-like domain-containing protein [Vicingus serpentipes]|nr:flippase-like domain-containing protein [Vicingus serpentipes]
MRLLIGVAALILILYKIKDDFVNPLYFQLFQVSHIHYIIIAFLLLFFNWGMEAYKWRFLMNGIENISFFTAFKLTITAITIGIITPNRIGEIPGRVLLLNNKDHFSSAILKTAIGAFSQLIITFILGTIAVFFTIELYQLHLNSIYVKVGLLLITVLLLLAYFLHQPLKAFFYKIPYLRNKKWLDGLQDFTSKQLLYILFLSGLRYFLFSLQYYLILLAFGVNFNSYNAVLLIPLCFMVTSLVPTLLISEIGVRGSVALLVFGIITNNEIAIVFSSVLLWLINVATPALIGLFFMKKLIIFQEK